MSLVNLFDSSINFCHGYCFLVLSPCVRNLILNFLIQLENLQRGYIIFQSAGQKVIGEPVVSGLVLNDSWLWNPDFLTAAK